MKIRVKLATLKRQFLLFLCTVCIVANGYAFTQSSLSSIMEEMVEKYQIDFTHNSLDFEKVEVDFAFDAKEDVDNAMQRLFKHTKYDYHTDGKNYFIISEKDPLDQFQNTKNYEQLEVLLLSVSGEIKDGDGNPMIGVNIIVKSNPNKGVISDIEGRFSIELDEGEDVLVFSYIGYQTQEVSVAGRSVLSVVLEPDSELLNEVVVVGYGTQKRSDLTGSIVSISSKEIESLPNPNIMDQVQGRMPGLTVVNSDARPGRDPEINIRGTNSINASNFPLIVLDGIPYSGALSSIVPSDIESMSILRDASATSIYGARGSNGVILITTKKGEKSERPTITLDTRTSFNRLLNKLDVLDADQYVKFKEYFGEEIGFPLQPSERDNLAAGKVTDWQDLATSTALQTDNTLSIRGAGDQMSYYASMSRLDQEGIVMGSEYNRTSFRLNGDYKMTDWMTVGTQLMLGQEDWGENPDISLNLVSLLSPLGNAYNDDGTNTQYPVREDQFFENPFDRLNDYYKSERNRVQSNFYAVIDFPFLEGLSYRLNYGRLEQRTDTDAFNPSTSLAGTGGGSASRSHNKVLDSTIENLLYYNRFFGDHRINATALYSFQESSNDNSSLSDGNFVSDALTYYGIGAGENDNGVGTGFSERKLISQMGSIRYGYKGKYNLTYTVRRDGSSVFGANNKWAVFQSGAVAWTISEENFLKDVSWIEFMKLRVSYGTSGNQAISPYQTTTRIGQGGSYYFNSTVANFGPQNLGNPNLRWESTESLNFAIEFNLFKNRLSGTIDNYKTTSNDLLRNRSLNSTQGFSSIISNIGSMENKGWEFTLRGDIIRKQDFTWNTAVNFFTNKNKIVVLDGRDVDDISGNLFIGEDINTIFGYEYGGVYANQAAVDASHQPDALPGDAIIVDVDGDGTITADDRTIVGRASPDYTMGIGNTLEYKNFQLSSLVFILQGERTVNNFINSRFWGQGRVNYADIDYWTPDNTDAKYPRPVFIDDRTRILEDRNFVRLKNITLGYTFGKAILDKIGTSNLRVYVAANNLFTITNWSGQDPETVIPGGNLGTYPSSKSIVLGASISL